MDEYLAWRIKTFFSFWRERLDFIQSLDLNKNYYEVNVIIWASIDALSNTWKRSDIRKKQSFPSKNGQGSRIIFNLFLEEYGGKTFSYVSLPDLWDRIDSSNTEKERKHFSDYPVVKELLGRVGNRKEPDTITRHLIRSVNDDQPIDSICREVVRQFPDVNKENLRKYIAISQYGSIAYKQLRCGYIHDGQPGQNSHSFPMFGYEFRPTYLYGKYDTPSKMSFSPQFMMQVLLQVIDNFESDSLQQYVDPVPENEN